MTSNRAAKQAVRARMEATGESYMAAKAGIENAHPLAPDAQLDRYVAAGYPERCSLSEADFREWLAPLVGDASADGYNRQTGTIKTLLVIRQRRVSAEAAMGSVLVRGRSGYVDMNPTTPDTFSERTDVQTPDSDAYLLHEFDPGDDLRSAPPSSAFEEIQSRGRSPITIDEAISAAVLYPQLVADKHAFSILASRSDAPKVSQSVPAIWISRGAPRLGWCWDNNPHSWLGSASCAARSLPT